MSTIRTGRTPIENTNWNNNTRPTRWKDYLVGMFTDNIFYNITDGDGNRIVIYDTSGFEKIDLNDYSKRNAVDPTIWNKRVPI